MRILQPHLLRIFYSPARGDEVSAHCQMVIFLLTNVTAVLMPSLKFGKDVQLLLITKFQYQRCIIMIYLQFSDSLIQVDKIVMSNQKSKFYDTRGVTPKRVTCGGAHFCGLAPGQHISEETPQRWRAVGDTVSI